MDIYIETLGCDKNKNDSQMMAGILEDKGHHITECPENAEAIIVNTCGFIDAAKRESIAAIFDMTEYKKEKCQLLIVSGCLSERYTDQLYEEIPEVDIFIGVNDYLTLPMLLKRHEKDIREKFKTPYCEIYEEAGTRKIGENPYSESIKIAEGCDNICAYCAIPYIRGHYRSRKKENIVKEAETLAERGCKELILVAQDVTAYGKDIYNRQELPSLLRMLCKIEGIKWIRLMYCYEDKVTDELIETMATEDKICNYIDMPVQHCNDSILGAMNRKSTKESILNTIKKLRKVIPDIHIRTTLMTGFPGEDEGKFGELVEFVESVRFERLGVFAYSREEGTLAAEMGMQVEDQIKEERKDAIMRRQMQISGDHNRKKIGSVLEVLVESKEGKEYVGRSRYDAPEIDDSIIFTGICEHVPGDLVQVEILDAFDYDLTGREV